VTRREAQHPAHPSLRGGTKQGNAGVGLRGFAQSRLIGCARSLQQECGEIIRKRVGRGVSGVALTASPGITGAEVTVRIMSRQSCGNRWRLQRSLPGALGPLRRYEHPFPAQRIEAPMRPSHERLLTDAPAARRRRQRRGKRTAPGSCRNAARIPRTAAA